MRHLSVLHIYFKWITKHVSSITCHLIKQKPASNFLWRFALCCSVSKISPHLCFLCPRSCLSIYRWAAVMVFEFKHMQKHDEWMSTELQLINWCYFSHLCNMGCFTPVGMYKKNCFSPLTANHLLHAVY